MSARPPRTIVKRILTGSLRLIVSALIAALMLLVSPALAETPPEKSFVQLSVSEYQQLEKLRLLGPSGSVEPLDLYATKATTRVEVTTREKKPTATAFTEYELSPPGPDARFVRIASTRVHVQRLIVDDLPARFLLDSGGYIASIDGSARRIQIVYDIPLDTSFGTILLEVSGASKIVTAVTIKVPGDISGLAFEGIETEKAEQKGGSRYLSGTVAPGGSARLRWSEPLSASVPFREALYEGTLKGDATEWTAHFSINNDDPLGAVLPFLPRSIAVTEALLDGAQAKLLMLRTAPGKEWHGVKLPAAGGSHQLQVRFEVPRSGFSKLGAEPPAVRFAVPESTITKVHFTAQGRYQISTMPIADVKHVFADGITTVDAALPTTTDIELRWHETLPEGTLTGLQQSALTAHYVRVDEGIASVRAVLTFDVTRGSSSHFDFSLPNNARISKVTSDSAGLIDWKVSVEDPAQNRVSAFFDRPIGEPVTLGIEYEVYSKPESSSFSIPLVYARDVARQRGTIVLLESGKILLEPKEDKAFAKFSSTPLPPDLAAETEHVSHTFKYYDNTPALALELQTKVPDAPIARIDASLRTLLSFGDTSIRGSTTVDVDVKSGSASQLQIRIPDGISLLDLTGPDVRGWELKSSASGAKLAAVSFKKDLEGQVRLTLRFERLLGSEQFRSPVQLPVLRVVEAETEEGVIAIEARSAMEVGIDSISNLTALAPADVPKQLVVTASRPILHAFRYANAVESDPVVTARLQLHRELQTLPGIIERSRFISLVTPDGKVITEATYSVRNQTNQFLKLTLPLGAVIWQATVNGIPERPAIQGAEGDPSAQAVLLRIISSQQPFSVRVLYDAPIDTLGTFGSLSIPLVKTDLISKESSWNVHVPRSMSILSIRSNMEVRAASAGTVDLKSADPQIDPAITIEIPAETSVITLRKSYDNMGGSPSFLTLIYKNGSSRAATALLALAGVLLLARGLRRTAARQQGQSSIAILGGAGLIVLAMILSGNDGEWMRPIAIGAGLVLAIAGWKLRRDPADAPQNGSVGMR